MYVSDAYVREFRGRNSVKGGRMLNPRKIQFF